MESSAQQPGSYQALGDLKTLCENLEIKIGPQ